MRVSYTIRDTGVFFVSRELQARNTQNKLALWAGRISECRNSGQSVKVWCGENGICEQTYFIYTLIDGKVSCYSLISDGTITACEDSILQATIHYGPENFTTRFYRLNRGRIELVDYLRYDVDVNPQNPWFRSLDLTGQDMTLDPISEKRGHIHYCFL